MGKHLDAADTVGDGVRQVQQCRGPAVRKPSIRVAVHSGRAVSSGDCSINSARSNTCRSEPGSATRILRTWKSRLKSGSTTQRGEAVGNVGTTTFCRSRNAFRDAFSNRVRKRSQSGVVSRISSGHDSRARPRICFSPMQEVIDRP